MSPRMLLIVAAAAAAGCATSTPEIPVVRGPASRYIGEAPPVVPVADALPPGPLPDAAFTLQSPVPVADYNYLFTIRTPYGDIPAHGREMLQLRLWELAAVKRANQLATENNIAAGATDYAGGAYRGTGALMNDAAGTIGQMPAALSVSVRRHLDASDRRAGSEARRRLAERLGCDPETNNPVLKAVLDRMSREQKIGNAAVGAIPVVGALAGFDSIRRKAASTPPHQLNEQAAVRLKLLGAPTGDVERFVDNMAFTTSQRLLLTEELERIGRLEGAADFVRLAARAWSEARALKLIVTIRHLADLHAKLPIARLHAGELPVAVHADGSHSLLLAADYVINTQEFVDALDEYRREFPQAGTRLILFGRISDAARATAAARRIAVQQPAAD